MARKKKGQRPRYILADCCLNGGNSRVTLDQIREYRKGHMGVGYDELFNLAYAFSAFILPRLELFRDETDGIAKEPGMTSREDLDAMIAGFGKVLDEKARHVLEHDEEVERALALFRDNIFNLWF